MSIYAVHKFLYDLELVEDLPGRAKEDLAAALDGYDLTDEERTALLEGDVGTLYQMGVHTFLLNGMSRNGLAGLTRELYLERVRAAAAASGGTGAS